MYPQKLEDFPPPPGVMGSLRAGFEAVASHVGLILLPAILDVLLWLGPRLSINGLIRPLFLTMWDQARSSAVSAADLTRFTEMQKTFFEVLQDFNLLSLLSRLQLFPIGVSSLLAQRMPIETPYGAQRVVEVSSGPLFILLTFALVVAGWMLGGLYFRWVSSIAVGDARRETEISSMRAIVQTLILSAIWMIGLMIVVIPLTVILVVLVMLNPLVASGAVFVLLLLSFWLIVPLFFTPHGIFVRRQNALYSIFTSLRMARFTLPTSGLFVVCVLLLSTGLKYIWSVPPDN